MTNAEVLRKVVDDLSHRGRDSLLGWAIKNIEAVVAALESEEVLAEGLADPDALAGYNAGRIHMLTIFKVQALYTDKPVRVLGAKGEQ